MKRRYYIIILTLIAVTIGAYLGLATPGEEVQEIVQRNQELSENYSDWKTYYNNEIGFQMNYPNNWKYVGEYDWSYPNETTDRFHIVFRNDNNEERIINYYCSNSVNSKNTGENENGQDLILSLDGKNVSVVAKDRVGGIDERSGYKFYITRCLGDDNHHYTYCLSFIGQNTSLSIEDVKFLESLKIYNEDRFDVLNANCEEYRKR